MNPCDLHGIGPYSNCCCSSLCSQLITTGTKQHLWWTPPYDAVVDGTVIQFVLVFDVILDFLLISVESAWVLNVSRNYSIEVLGHVLTKDTT